MELLHRLTTLARADAHGVVDALEDRTLLLRQHLREAEAELQRKRCRIEALEAEEEGLESRHERLQREMESLEEDVELAMAGDKEDLARFAIRRLLPARRAAEQVADRRTELEKERSVLAERLAAQEEEYRDLECRVRSFLTREEPSSSEPPFGSAAASDEEVELELLRRRRAAEEEGA